MADFLTRVELHDADTKQRAALDQAMAAYNFSNTHISTRGVVYQFPEGTYFSQSINMSATDVRDMAIAAVRNLGCRYDIVSVLAGAMAYSLHPAR